jgi:riboflavin synthase
MFTGVIKKIGKLEKNSVDSSGAQIVVRRPAGWKLRKGDSIAVNGVCSTVASLTVSAVSFTYMPETLERTTVRGWKKGGQVHLEQSLTLRDRLDGHMVMGHVDTTGCVESLAKEGNSTVVTIAPASRDLRFAAEKGSVALDGVSLTIAGVTKKNFKVKVVPFTWEYTRFHALQVGDEVNIEWDMVAKYIEQMRKA